GSDTGKGAYVHSRRRIILTIPVCPKCGGRHFRKEKDILDVWFDSGLSHRAVCGRRENLYDPADMYLEGSDQPRGWFQVSLLTGIGLMGRAPYRKVVTHGWTLTESGEKESKSKGNYTDPELMCDQLGADILRLWVSSTNYMQDVMISENILRQIGDAYRRIRNTFKYILGNIDDFRPENAVPFSELSKLDRYMLHALETLRSQVTEAYEKNEYHRAFHALYNFCSVDLSARYCDILKDTLYADEKDSRTRRGAQTVLRRCAIVLAKLLAPILVFTSEEVWECLTRQELTEEEGKEPTVHLSKWPAEERSHLDPALAEQYEKLWFVRDEVLRELEALRQAGKIGSGQEAEVEVWSDDPEWLALLQEYAADLKKLCIVSDARVAKPAAGRQADKLTVAAFRSDKPKCARCWNCSEEVGSDPEHPDVCARCADVLKKQAN
ncbi:class I tRNA ligase family protein, partial [bacterium]|nr:class I tRNA ligase family protein [bacterium]